MIATHHSPSVGMIPHGLADWHEARIMIADDMVANVKLLRTILSRAGYTSLWSTDAADNVISGFVEFSPDIVLLDLHMPGVDGLELVHQIRELNQDRPYVPLVVLTGDTSPEARCATLAAGASDFLTKPYDAAEVLLRVRN